MACWNWKVFLPNQFYMTWKDGILILLIGQSVLYLLFLNWKVIYFTLAVWFCSSKNDCWASNFTGKTSIKELAKSPRWKIQVMNYARFWRIPLTKRVIQAGWKRFCTNFSFINSFPFDVPFLYPLKPSENCWLSSFFRGYKKGSRTWNELKNFDDNLGACGFIEPLYYWGGTGKFQDLLSFLIALVDYCYFLLRRIYWFDKTK